MLLDDSNDDSIGERNHAMGSDVLVGVEQVRGILEPEGAWVEVAAELDSLPRVGDLHKEPWLP